MRHEYLIPRKAGQSTSDLSAAAQLLQECAGATLEGEYILSYAQGPVGHLVTTDRVLTADECAVTGVVPLQHAA